MQKNKHSQDILARVFDTWQDENKRIDAFADRLLEWFAEAEGTEFTRTNAVAKVRSLATLVKCHFANETLLTELLVEAKGRLTPELKSTKRAIERGHLHLLGRLKEVILKLKRNEPKSEGWLDGVAELGLLVDALDQHEEEEAVNFTSLFPNTTNP